MNYTTGISNDILAKTYEITNLDKNVKNTQNCDKCLMYRLFLLIETSYHVKIHAKNNQNANTIPGDAVEAT